MNAMTFMSYNAHRNLQYHLVPKTTTHQVNMAKTLRQIICTSRAPRPLAPYKSPDLVKIMEVDRFMDTLNSSKVLTLTKEPTLCFRQAVKVNNMVFLSGVLGMDRQTNKLVEGTVADETRQLLKNLEVILNAAGSGINKLVKTTIMLNDINDFSTVNEIYKEAFTENYPARSTYQVAKLPLGARIEIEAIGLCGDVETETLLE